jgi:hypothetical protein
VTNRAQVAEGERDDGTKCIRVFVGAIEPARLASTVLDGVQRALARLCNHASIDEYRCPDERPLYVVHVFVEDPERDRVGGAVATLLPAIHASQQARSLAGRFGTTIAVVFWYREDDLLAVVEIPHASGARRASTS